MLFLPDPCDFHFSVNIDHVLMGVGGDDRYVVLKHFVTRLIVVSSYMLCFVLLRSALNIAGAHAYTTNIE